MHQVEVNKRRGFTTSVIPHRNGKYPVWFNDCDVVLFVRSEDVVFIEDSEDRLYTKNEVVHLAFAYNQYYEDALRFVVEEDNDTYPLRMSEWMDSHAKNVLIYRL